MKRISQITSLFFIAFSILIFVLSIKLKIGSFQVPGPGFLGFLSSILLFILSSIIFVMESKKSYEDTGEGGFSRGSLTKPIILTVALCGFALSLETFGFLLAGFLLMWVMLIINNPKKWLKQILVALIVVNVTYFILYKLLGVILPLGILGIQW